VTVSNVVRHTNYPDGFVVLLSISTQQKVTVSNVVRDTNYPDGFVVLLSISNQMFRYLSYDTAASFHIPPNSLFINNLTIRRCIA
jgi:hypothetical protein